MSQCDGHAPHSRPQRQGRGGPSVQADALAGAGRGTGVSAGGLSSSVVPSFSRPSPGTEASVGPAVTAAGSGDRSHALHSAAAIPFAAASWVSRSEATKEEHFVTKGQRARTLGRANDPHVALGHIDKVSVLGHMKVRSRTPCGSGGTRPQRAHDRDREMSSRSQQTPCRVFIFSTNTMRPAAVTKKGRDVDHLPPVNSRKREPCRSRLRASLHVDTHSGRRSNRTWSVLSHPPANRKCQVAGGHRSDSHPTSWHRRALA